ncbi:MAG: TonB-dependent receptor, partial [Porticoccaceae bacterium]|nr:TonB-dependent receptor [Porticoccaceae bacterium]
RGLVFPNLAVDVQSGGNASLQEEEGKSYNIGAVYDISDSLTLSLDLYRLSLEGILASASSDSAYRLATSCQFGQDPGGNPVDPNSALCRAVSRSFNFNNATNSLVPSGTGVAITNSSFNSSLREQDGMDVKLDGHFNFGDASLSAGLTYTHIFKIRFQELPGGPIDNRFRDNETNGELRSRATLTTTWSQGPWSVTLYGQHLGSAPRQNPSFGSANRGRLAPWTSWTLSGDFELTGSLGLSLIVNNLFDKEPSFDESAIGSPFRNVSLYSTLGRQYVIDLSYRF